MKKSYEQMVRDAKAYADSLVLVMNRDLAQVRNRDDVHMDVHAALLASGRHITHAKHNMHLQGDLRRSIDG